MSNLYSIDQAKEICQIALEVAKARGAMQPIVLDVSDYSGACSVMMIMSHQQNATAKSIAKEIIKEVKDQGYTINAEESSEGWYLVGIADLFIHVMTQEKRDHYMLEEIWRHAGKIQLA